MTTRSGSTVWLRGLVPTGLFTAKGMLLRAGMIVIAFLVCHVLGLREYTSILCGQSATGNVTDRLPIVLGCLYLMLYFLAVLGAPILVLAAGIIIAGETYRSLFLRRA
jgi:hypothetical protein